MKYFDEETRRATFNSWVFNSNESCSAEKMAEAGFIYTGSAREPDSAQCFYCNKSLDGWEASDDPWKEHLKHATNCDFAKMQKCQLDWTLSEWLDMLHEYMKKLIRHEHEQLRIETEKYYSLATHKYRG